MAEENEALFREIDEELRQDKATEMWKAYGNYIIGGALALVLGVAGFQGWKSYDSKQKMARGEVFQKAATLASESKNSAAITEFEKMAADSNDGYAQLARFRAAGLLAKSGDFSAAAAAYRALSESDDLVPQYRDLAVVLGAMQELNISGGDAPLTGRLNELLDAQNPWRHSAREILGLAAIKNGNTEKAREHFKALADDATTPQGLAQRATEMLKTIKQSTS